MPAGRAGVGCVIDPRRLRDDGEVLVPVPDRDLRALGLGRRGPGATARSTSSRSPPASRWAFGRGLPSTRTSPRRDRPLDLGPRRARQRRDDGVEPARRRPQGPGLSGHRRRRAPRAASERRGDQQQRPDHDRRVRHVEDRPDVHVDEVDDLAARTPVPRVTRSSRLPRAPPRISPRATDCSRGRSRNATTPTITLTVAAATTKNHGTDVRIENAPPGFDVNRSVSTPRIDVDRLVDERALRPQLRETVERRGRRRRPPRRAGPRAAGATSTG